MTMAGDPRAEVGALLRSAAACPLDGIGWVAVTGEDRVRWLNGMVTNSIQSMGPGEGSYSFVLNAQGRIQGELTAFAEAERLLLEIDLGELPRLVELLERFIIMDEVELARTEELPAGVLVAGPEAEAVLVRLGVAAALPRTSPGSVRGSWRGEDVRVVRSWGPLVPRFEVWSRAAARAGLLEAIAAAGAAPCGAEALELLRVIEGTPRFGVDIRDRDLAQETGQTRALHFSKGCYLGQEIVERIRSRGAVHRGFSGFVLEGDLPAPGEMQLFTEDGAGQKVVGELTSIVALPAEGEGGRTLLALGYVRRETRERGDAIRYAGGVARPRELPFRLAASPGSPDASEG